MKGEEMALYMPQDPEIDMDFEINSMCEDIENAGREIITSDFHKYPLSSVRSLIAENTLTLAQSNENYNPLCKTIARADREHMRILIAKGFMSFLLYLVSDKLMKPMEIIGRCRLIHIHQTRSATSRRSAHKELNQPFLLMPT